MMEEKDRDELSDIFITCSVSFDKQSVYAIRDHILLYVTSGRLDIDDRGRRVSVAAGGCVFMHRDNRLLLLKHGTPEEPFRCIMLRFTRRFLRDFYASLPHRSIPSGIRRQGSSLVLLPDDRPDIKSLFHSIEPYLESDTRPGRELMMLKLTEGAYVLLNTDASFYASLFDFTEQWKMDIFEFLNANYMYDLSLEEIAAYTGRSLATFKRDFAKVSDLTPRRWIIRRRLDAAREQIHGGSARVSDICYSVGFKNLSHFSRVYKATFGVSPACDGGDMARRQRRDDA